ncbi:MAG: Fic family protein [Nanohaloarchaea archaeon]|nr:Fic family protein [Candidatus Nanohaloarchaea archaeon]
MNQKKFLEIECSKLPGILTEDYIKALNALVTEPPSKNGKTVEPNTVEKVSVGSMEEFEFGREEDYHQLRPDGEGIIQSLVQTILPYKCKERNDALWLTAVIMNHVAENQAFGEGNKRTAYLSGTLFWIWAQYEADLSQGVYVDLTVDFTDLLSEVAIDEKGAEDIYRYLRNILSKETNVETFNQLKN